MTRIWLVLALAAIGAPVQTTAQTPAPAEFAVLLKAARDTTMSAADREKLAGQTYVGFVEVETVRFNPDGTALVDTRAVEEKPDPRVVLLRFATTQDDQALSKLKRGTVVRIRATLTRLVTTGPVPTLEFSAMAILAVKD